MLKKFSFICLVYLIRPVVFGQQGEIVLTNENLTESFGEYAGVLEDEEKKYNTVAEVLELPEESFEQGDEAILNFDFTAKRYWLRLKVTNQSDFDHFILETGRTVTNKVEFFEIEGKQVIAAYKSGDDFSYEAKEISHRKNLFPLSVSKGETKNYLIKLESDGELLFVPVLIHDRMAFFAQDFKDQFKNGFYYGLIALVVIIYFFFFFFLRDKTFLFYILYVFSQGVLQFSLDGYSHHHFFPGGGYFTNHILLVFAGFTVIFLLTYVNNFLKLKEVSPVLWRVFYYSRILMCFIIVMSLIPGPLYEFSFPVINSASLLSILLAAYSIIRLQLKGEKVDLFFALAFMILIIGGVVFILGNLSIVGDKIVSLGALKISSALEFVVLSISMSNKYGRLQREKDEAQKLALKNLREKNALMDQSNIRLEQQVKERTSEINRQKEELAKSNEEIVSSIKYAKRIQQAILPSDEHIQRLLPEVYIFYQPKDVVSGDFYFVESAQTSFGDQKRYTIFAAVDCTGHGVPGAFMSIVGNNLLTQSLTEPTVNSPGEALEFLNAGVNKTLRRSIEGQVVKDGMDIAICALSADRKQLVFAGAKNPLYLIRKNEYLHEDLPEKASVVSESGGLSLIQIKGDKHPVGNSFEDELLPYQNHSLSLQSGDQIVVFTDGFADQFGGEKGKKYNYRRFREYLLKIYHEPMATQRNLLIKEFNTWRGKIEQIDDVLIVSIKV